MRSEAFLNALEQVPKYFLTAGWFDQFAFSLVCGVRGKTHTSSRLYCGRQRHLAQDSVRSAKTEPYRSWPRLLASPDFSDIYQSFCQCLIDNCREFVSIDDEELKLIIDRGLVAFRSHCTSKRLT